MKVVITAYKGTGKFYTDEVVELPEDKNIYDMDVLAEVARQSVPLLSGGFVHMRLTDEDAKKPSAPFFNYLFKSDYLRCYL